MQLTAADYERQATSKLEQAKSLVTQLEDNASRTLANTAEPLNDITILLDWVLSTASLFQSVHPDVAMREAAERVEQAASQFQTDLSMNRAVYDAFAALPRQADPVTQRFIDHTLRDFRRSGVDKPEAVRARLKALAAELVTLSQDFGRNIREDVRSVQLPDASALDGLPDDYRAAHAALSISTDAPDYVPFMTYAKAPALRRQLYTVYRQRGWPKNEAVLKAIISKRHEQAQLLGYAHYADYVTETRMIKNAKSAEAFVERVASLATPHMQRDYAALLAQKRTLEPSADTVHEWERAYLDEQVKRDRFAVSAQETRDYFEYRATERGVLATTEALFSVRFTRRDEEQWHPSVSTYDVERDGEVIGRFMLDMFPRKDKYKHAAQFTLQSGVAGRQIPIGVLVCNFPDPNLGPALMEHKDVVTFFHEFGHLMHHLLGGQQRWARFSGVATEWDFVEAPSQMFEEWAWDHEVLSGFAKHHVSGEPIGKALVERMRAAEEFGKGIQARVQMFYAALSLSYYSTPPEALDLLATVQALQTRISPFAYVPDTHFHLSFGHLDGYSAGYYTYMWSLVIAKDLFSAFASNGLMDRATATRYRDTVLGAGGQHDAAELCQQFLGRPFAFDAFEGWLARA